MTKLMIDGIDESTLGWLSSRAQLHHRTVEAEAAAVIRQATRFLSRRETLVERAEAIAAMTPKGVKQTDSTVILREERDR